MTKSPLWLASDIASATGGKLQGDFFVTGISNDTRTLQPGDLYIALGGLGRHDGHDFIDQAFAVGANGVLLSQQQIDKSVLVDNTFRAMQKLGQAARDRVLPTCKIIAITGSVGKTTTRALTAKALSVFGSLHASEHSLNNQWGVPLTLARMPADTHIGVFEVGMNHAGEILELTKQIRPHIAIITTVEAIHSGNFADGVDGVARAKAEIFAGVEPGGTAILHRDNPHFDMLCTEAAQHDIKTIVSFGQHHQADLRLVNYERLDQGGMVTASIHGETLSFLLPIRSEHNALNALAALGAVHAMGLDVEQAAAQFATLEDVEGRGNINIVPIPNKGEITLIDDRHNSSPVALTAAIREFSYVPVSNNGRRILALGDMLELGDQSPELHAAIAEVIAGYPIDLVLTCGPLMAHLAQALPAGQNRHYIDSQAMAAIIGDELQDGDAILIKGSRGAKMIAVVDALNRLSQT